MGQNIENWKTNVLSAIPPAFGGKSLVNFGPLTTNRVEDVHFCSPKLAFSEEKKIPCLRGIVPSNFHTCYRMV